MPANSTKIEDLPDNNEDSAKILNELKDDVSETSEPPSPKATKGPATSTNKFDDIFSLGKDSLIVFIIIILMTNEQLVNILSKLPYVSNYNRESMIFSSILALIGAIIYFGIKYSINNLV